MENSCNYIELEVLTPLSVGAGNDNDWIKGADYVQKDGFVYVLDMSKVAKEGIDISRLTELFLNYDEAGICKLLGDKLERISKYKFKSPVNSQNSIKTFIRSEFFDLPVIAGSSIKGAIRSILFKYFRNNEKATDGVFGSIKDGTDFMRFFQIRDIEMPSTILVNTKLFNLYKDEQQEWHGGWKHAGNRTNRNYQPIGFNTIYETIQPGHKGYGLFALKANEFEKVLKHNLLTYADKKRVIIGSGLQQLFRVINQHTKEYLEKERLFFETYGAARTGEITDSIDHLLSIIPKDNSYCILKMSAGVGFHSITGDFQYKDYTSTGIWSEGRNAGKKKYKSRKIVEYNHQLQMMGFVKIQEITESSYKERLQEQEKSHQIRIENILSPLKKKNEDAEKRAKELEIKKEQLLKEEKFNNLYSDANQLYLNNQYDDALSKAHDAQTICDNEIIKMLIAKIESAKKAGQEKEKDDLNKIKLFSQPLQTVLYDKATSLGNIIGTTKKWLGFEGHAFTDEEFEVLKECIRQLPDKEKKSLMKKQKELVKAIGKDYAEKLLKDLGLIK